MEPVSRRPRLVAKRQLTVFGRKFGDELARRRFRGVDLAKIANVPSRPSSATATALRNFDVSIPTKARLCWSTTRPPCLRLCPANPGNPRRNIEGESPLEGRTYSLGSTGRVHACQGGCRRGRVWWGG